MPELNLQTTNLLLGIMAAVSVLEALVLIGIGVAGFRMYRQVTSTVESLEERHVRPIVAQLNAILVDVKGVAARVNQRTEKVDHAISETIDRVDATTERVKSSMVGSINQVVGVVRGIRSTIVSMLTGNSRHHHQSHEMRGSA